MTIQHTRDHPPDRSDKSIIAGNLPSGEDNVLHVRNMPLNKRRSSLRREEGESLRLSNNTVAVQVSMSDFVGNSIDGAKVELFGDTDYDPVYSGSNGMASLGQVVPGNYTLHVLYPDGQFFERSVPVWGGNDILIEIEPTHIPIRLVINGQTNPGLNIELNGYGEDPAIEQANIGYNEAGRSFTLDFTIPAGAAGVYRLE